MTATRPIVEALRLRPLSRPPVWIMRQAGRYLPEYRRLRSDHSFQEAVSNPDVAAEITMQPIRRFGLDGAVIFADIMTPLEAMGVPMTFDPGPRLAPHTLAEVASLADLNLERVGFVGETIRRVRDGVPDEVAVIGFAGGPMTLLAYLIEGGGSREFLGLRAAIHSDPGAARAALDVLARAMNSYLCLQKAAGADVVQLFDSWSQVLDRRTFEDLAIPAARTALAGIDVPRIYFAPGGSHLLDLQPQIGVEAFGLDWRIPILDGWERVGDDVAIQGNLDPAILLTDAATIRRETRRLIDSVDGRPGHVVNLGHGIDRRTSPENVAVFVETVRG